MLRKITIRLRREYNTNFKNIVNLAVAVLLISTTLGVLLDIFLPFERWWNVLRSLILIPETASLFTLFYLGAVHMHYQRVATDADWQPYRLRFSLSRRRKMAAVVMAVIFVFIYATSFGPGYTFMSSVLLALIFCLAAFIRPTTEEHIREEYGLPDNRDVKYQQERDERNRIREEADEEKREKRRARVRWLIGTDGKNSTEEK